MNDISPILNKDPKRFIAWFSVLLSLAVALVILNNINTPDNSNSMALVSEYNTGPFEGELDVIKSDDFENEKNVRYDYYIRDKQGKGTPIDVRGISKEKLENLRTGNKVKINGHKNNKKEIEALDIQVTDATTSGDPLAADPQAVINLEERKAVVMLVNFADKNTSATLSGVTSVMYTGTSNVDRWYRTSSQGQLGFNPDTDANGSPDVFGPFTIPSLSSTSSCNYYQWAYEAESLAQAAGVDFSKYQHRVFVVPSNGGCGWSGIANLGCGTFCRAWTNTQNAFVLTHELGHNLGMHHASTDPENDGIINSEYGDYSDPMGYGRTLFSGPNDVKNGWASPFPNKVVDITQTGEYYLSPMSFNPETSSSSQVLRIRKGTTSEYYFISFRKAEGMDASISATFTAGASIHRSTNVKGGRTYLIRTLSSTVPTWTDSANGITITQLEKAVDGSYVKVLVDLQVVCTPNQPTVTLSPVSQSSSKIEALTYNVAITNNDSGCGSTVFTPTVSAVSGTGLTGTFSSSQITLLPAQTTNVSLSVLPSADGTSSFTVAMKDLDAKNPAHNDVSVTGQISVDSTPPQTPVLSGTTNNQGAATLSWTAVSDNVGVIGYDVLRNGVLITTVTGTTYTDKPSTGTYTYTVRARDAAQNVSVVSNGVTLSVTKSTGKPSRR